MPKNNTIIHKTHSKKDLLNYIRVFSIPTGLSSKNNKFQVAEGLWDIISKIDFIAIPVDNDLLIKDLIGLRTFLLSPNPNKLLTIKEKDDIVLISKKILHYCDNFYDIDICCYFNREILYQDASYIAHHADIPIVRKAISKLMNDPKKYKNITIKVSPMIQKKLNDKRTMMNSSHYKCKVLKGSFWISFD